MNTSLRRAAAATFNLANAGLAAGTTSTYTTAAATVCSIGGVFATSLGAQTNTATPTTDVNTGVAFPAIQPNYGSVFVFGVNAAGAIKVAKGSSEPLVGGVTTTAGTFANSVPQFPVLPDDFCPIGYVVVRVAPSGAAWTFGSSSWGASGIATSFKNITSLPDRPQTA